MSSDFLSNKSIKFQLSNSFIFFMSDHGNNIDLIVDYPLGKLESNNPFLSIIVPGSLRSNTDLMEQLSANSKQLITHYDVYATLLELSEVDFYTFRTIDFNTIY